TYESKDFNALIQAQYYGKGKFDVDEAPNARNIMGVSDWWLFNATVGTKVNDQFGLKLIVDNVFNAKPPFPALAGSANSVPTYY
ncbi:TonB-dependent receptor, partial [Marinobacter sp. 71-i]